MDGGGKGSINWSYISGRDSQFFFWGWVAEINSLPHRSNSSTFFLQTLISSQFTISTKCINTVYCAPLSEMLAEDSWIWCEMWMIRNTVGHTGILCELQFHDWNPSTKRYLIWKDQLWLHWQAELEWFHFAVVWFFKFTSILIRWSVRNCGLFWWQCPSRPQSNAVQSVPQTTASFLWSCPLLIPGSSFMIHCKVGVV